MNRRYFYHYKKKWFWKKIQIIGHQWNKETDKMVLYLPNGGIQELPNYSKLEVKLNEDWVLSIKEQAEKESSQKINLEVGK